MDKNIKEKIAFSVFRLLSFLVIGILFAILGFIVYNGAKVISWDFITKMPEEGMTKGGIYPAIVGTLILITGSTSLSRSHYGMAGRGRGPRARRCRCCTVSCTKGTRMSTSSATCTMC